MKRKPGFSSAVIVEWSQADRSMIILEPIEFVDSNGIAWNVRVGDVIDGASIPRFCWRIIGSPYSGKYRRASVVHDVYCVSRSRPHAEVHKMFYEAMLYDGVGKKKAWTMYQAVKNFGPKWKMDK